MREKFNAVGCNGSRCLTTLRMSLHDCEPCLGGGLAHTICVRMHLAPSPWQSKLPQSELATTSCGDFDHSYTRTSLTRRAGIRVKHGALPVTLVWSCTFCLRYSLPPKPQRTRCCLNSLSVRCHNGLSIKCNLDAVIMHSPCSAIMQILASGLHAPEATEHYQARAVLQAAKNCG